MGYVELHSHSAYSFLDGASLPQELAARAAELGHEALAITDHDGVWGAMEFAHACRGLGVRPIVGAEVSTDAGHLTLLCESQEGWRNLCRLLTEAHAGTRTRPAGSSAGASGPAGSRELPLPPSVRLASVETHAEGLVCLSGCAREGALAAAIEREEPGLARTLGERLRGAFGPERFRVELQRPLWRQDRRRNRLLAELAEHLGVAAVATGNVHAHDRSRTRLQDAFVAVRHRTTLDQSEPLRRGNGSAVLLSPAQAAERFAEHPGAVEEAGRLAERLRFDLTRDLGYSYPGREDPDADPKLARLCAERFEARYPRGCGDRREARARLEEELRIIRKLGLSGFFLLHHDLLELAREVAAEVRGPDAARGLLPPGRGRGSSVGSIVCYLTGLSHIDPVRNRLFLGRFLNEEITALPDIDLDFPRDVREKLIPRVHERYGRERSALVAAFATYRSRGAIRDLGKALGLPAGEIERTARSADMHGGAGTVERDVATAMGAKRSGGGRWRMLVELAGEAQGLPRHASQHPGGMVIATRPLIEICPVVPAAMEGRQMVQWDKDSCADAGFLKIDLLGLGMLSAVERCVSEIARVRGERLDLSRIPYDDPETYGAIQRAETTGVFQIESRAQMQMLPRTLPENLDDLTVQVALVRPGPIQGGAVHPYIERRKRLREDPAYEVPYDHPCLEPILSETLGAIVFQDQVLEVAMALAGFSAGEAEGLRRAMSRKRSEAAIRSYRDRFIEGAVERGVSREVAERVFDQVRGFSGFGFPKAHSTAFGLLAYQSTWLRVHRAPEFLCGLLNEQPMGFYPPDSLIHEAQRRGIEMLPVDVNSSGVNCSVEPLGGGLAVRMGLGYVDGVREAEVEALVSERERGGPYGTVAELASRSGAGRATLERLAWAGAVDGLVPGLEGMPEERRRLAARRRALWLLGVVTAAERRSEGTQLSLAFDPPDVPKLPDLTRWERMTADYGSTKTSIFEHPMALMREEVDAGAVTTADLKELPDGRRLKIAGLVIARQRPATAKGVTFMLLEDEFGQANLVILPPVFDRQRLTIRAEPFVVVEGRLERREGVINILVDSVRRLERPDLPLAKVRELEDPIDRPNPGQEAARIRALAAVAPAGHSFGRRTA